MTCVGIVISALFYTVGLKQVKRPREPFNELWIVIYPQLNRDGPYNICTRGIRSSGNQQHHVYVLIIKSFKAEEPLRPSMEIG